MPTPIRIEIRTEGIPPDPEAVRLALLQAMTTSVNVVRGRAVQNLSGPFLRVQTGAGRASLTAFAEQRGDRTLGVVGTNLFYLAIQHAGAPGPWEIRPGRARALRFTLGGRVVYAARVTHPGLRPRPWLEAALLESEQDVLDEFHFALQQAVARR